MPYNRGRGGASPNVRRTFGASSSTYRTSGHHRPAPMSKSDWSEIVARTTISGLPGVKPSDFARGPPPDPAPGDSYPHKWLKLVWMETYDAYATFVDTEKRKAFSFSERAPLRVNVGPFDEKTKLCSLTISGSDASRDYALPEGASAAEFVHAMLKLRQGLGWVYVRTVNQSRSDGRVVLAAGKLYSEDMASTQTIETGEGLCIAFDAYSSCLGRFHALQQYSSIDKNVREVIEGVREVIPRGRAALGLGVSRTEHQLLTPVSSGLRTKLNDVQLRIMKQLREPVDFVQGPPGTGKSTFIVELLRTRIASGAKVLLCTTTNKAIDSLAEKLHASGHRDVVAIGNASRLGPTSLTLTLPAHVTRHKASVQLKALAHAAKAAGTAWDSLRCDAEKKAAEELSAFVADATENDPEFMAKRDAAEERWVVAMFQQERDAWKARAAGLREAVEKVLALPENSRKLVAYLKGKADLYGLTAAIDALLLRSKTAVVAISQLLTGVSNFLKATSHAAEGLMKLQILEAARFVVCTAATAVKLPTRIAHELDALSEVPKAILSGTSADQLADQLAGLSVTGEEDGPEAEIRTMLGGLLHFKYVVLDEAGAMLEPDMVGTVIHGCRFLLCVGDHKQLPPFTTWRSADDYKYNTSLLERLAKGPGVPHDHNVMTVQYRMPPPLAAIVSDIFYDGTLSTPAQLHPPRTHPTPVVFQHVGGQEEKQGTSFKNTAEVREVMRIVRNTVLMRGRGGEQTVNIIAFHKPQSFALQRALKEEAVGGSVEVMTVDSMQGREADVVVLSCVRTGGQLGFLANRNRLNVAISRARQVLYIVGDSNSLRAGGSHPWRQLLGHGNLSMQVA